MLDLNREA
jgi:hypothetical protein